MIGSNAAILLVSDIHMALAQMMRLKEWHHRHCATRFDLVIIPGDIGVLDPANASEAEERASLAEITALVNSLEYLKCPVLVVPGNHDPGLLFEARELGQALVLHNAAYKFDDLWICGFGGSLPARFKEDDCHWQGYPFHSE
jgi:Icc-related predicted phosphoesterase